MLKLIAIFNRATLNTALLRMALALFLSLPLTTWATVGGGQRIEILGYEATDNKVYILRHFDDGRGRLPQLYYYDLDAKYPQPLIEVRSLYINPKTKEFDEYDEEHTFFTVRLNRIKQRIVPLKFKFKTTHIDVKSITQKKQNMTSWLGDADYITQYIFNYRVIVDGTKYASSLQTITTYSVCLSSDYNIYPIPNRPYAIATVTYLGTVIEGGYNYEEAILLKK